jgi:hypothetical protein
VRSSDFEREYGAFAADFLAFHRPREGVGRWQMWTT